MIDIGWLKIRVRETFVCSTVPGECLGNYD